MKSLKNVVLVFAVLAMLPMKVFAQKTEKIDCKNEACVLEILEKLKSPDQTTVSEAKAQVEIWANHVRYTGDPEMKDALKNAIFIVFEKYKYYDCDEYLFAELSRFCNKYDADDILRLASIEPIAGAAIRCVGDIPGSQDVITKYIDAHQDNLQHKDALAYAVGKLQITSMEDVLVSWLDDADDPTKIEIYNALMIIRSNDETTAIIEKGAKKLSKRKAADSKIAGMRLLVALNGEKEIPVLYKALKNKDGRVRREALELLKPYANDEVAQVVVKKCKKGDAAVDAVNWLGDVKNGSQMEFVMNQFSSKDPKAVDAAIRTVFILDYAEGINAVKPLFGGAHQEVIKESLITYEGDYITFINNMLKQNNAGRQYAALQVVECRPETHFANRVKELTNSTNTDVRDEAYKVLKLVMTPAQTQYLMTLLEYCDDKYVEDVQLAIKNATQKMPDKTKDEYASTLKHVRSDLMPRFYNVFAYFGTELCVDKLIDAYQNSMYQFEAKEALLLVENKKFKEKIDNVLK
jgi:HEAT repeat protein